jgi:Fur family ferric uptake transcriptional regulator
MSGGTAGMTDDILMRIRDDGGRVTAARRLVIEAMVSSSSHHLTAHDVVDAVRRRFDPDFHPSTVYRTLDRLAELGVVDRIQIGAGPAVYHLAHPPHHHLVCDGCGAVQEAPADLLDAVTARLAGDSGFALHPGGTTLHGLCATCAPA